MKYPKIQTLFKRDKDNKFVIMPDKATKPEFFAIKQWLVTEKIDGTNIRVMYTNIGSYEEDGKRKEVDEIEFRGRTDRADIPEHLKKVLMDIFTCEKMRDVFEGAAQVILFGEGYGPKIQKGGGKYRKDAGFILFDIWIDGWWLEYEKLQDIAHQLDIPIVPKLGIWTLDMIEAYCRTKPKSVISCEEKIAEGIVATSYPMMCFRNGDPIKFKLKVKDYIQLEEMNCQ